MVHAWREVEAEALAMAMALYGGRQQSKAMRVAFKGAAWDRTLIECPTN